VSTVRVTYRKSSIGYAWDQKRTLAALGLKKLNHSVEHEATPSIRGMVHKVRHLVSVDGLAADSPAGVELLRTLASASEDAA
jgi:large subunit ribosomal protein L30